ncbi:unnamed protein product [Moneuplotes crassus]|uniref:Uncharacterized protein n=1 Tax=Euplotes crassus TaxID=5936 RepID=A0AAD1Y6U2_EUPCR|nr:unnamed protein product [Moneuplotes crassus]
MNKIIFLVNKRLVKGQSKGCACLINIRIIQSTFKEELSSCRKMPSIVRTLQFKVHLFGQKDYCKLINVRWKDQLRTLEKAGLRKQFWKNLYD